MADVLVTVGIIFVVLAIWKGRSQSVQEQHELEEFKKVRDELAETKKEVGSLMEQLEAVSEKVVEEISAAVEEARRSDMDASAKSHKVSAGETFIDKDDTEEDNIEEGNIEDDDNYDEDNDGDNDDAIDDDSDGYTSSEEKHPELIVKLSGRVNQNPPKVVIKAYAEQKKISPLPTGAGKTILFPRKPEGDPDRASALKHSAPETEVPPKHQMIYAMAKLGYPEAEIARQLNIGRGEVRLILQLKRKGEEANG